MIEVRHYTTASGKNVYEAWLASLRDKRTEARIEARIDRICDGNFGDSKPLGQGVWELRINYGPGYRVYYAMIGRTCLILLCGGDKRSQEKDIARAIEYFNDYKRRRVHP